MGDAGASPHTCPTQILVLGRIYSPIHDLSEEEEGQIWMSQLPGVGGEGDRGQGTGGCAQLSSEQTCTGLMCCCDFSSSQVKPAPSLSSPS